MSFAAFGLLPSKRLWECALKGSPTGRGRLSPATGVAWDSVGPKAAERKNRAASGAAFLMYRDVRMPGPRRDARLGQAFHLFLLAATKEIDPGRGGRSPRK